MKIGSERHNLSPASPATRRAALGAITSFALVPVAATVRADGDERVARAIREIAGSAVVRTGRVKLSLPELAENGNSVTMSIAVDSPMTAADHVRTIHVLSEKNPVTGIMRFDLGPRSGRADVRANIRLADTQQVTALAEMSDGTFWLGAATVIVTITACTDAG